MTTPHVSDKGPWLGRSSSGRQAQSSSKPTLDRCTLPPSRIQRAQELIAMARAARTARG